MLYTNQPDDIQVYIDCLYSFSAFSSTSEKPEYLDTCIHIDCKITYNLLRNLLDSEISLTTYTTWIDLTSARINMHLFLTETGCNKCFQSIHAHQVYMGRKVICIHTHKAVSYCSYLLFFVLLCLYIRVVPNSFFVLEKYSDWKPRRLTYNPAFSRKWGFIESLANGRCKSFIICYLPQQLSYLLGLVPKINQVVKEELIDQLNEKADGQTLVDVREYYAAYTMQVLTRVSI